MPSVGVARATVSTVPRGVESHEVERQRTLRATDSDWERVGAAGSRGRDDGVGLRALAGARTALGNGVGSRRAARSGVRDRIFKAVLVLWELERRRLADTGDADSGPR